MTPWKRARARTIWLAVVGVAVAFAFSAGAVSAQPPGNSGTVKIHDGATDSEPVIKNEPHVCTFHLHFYFADPAQSGDWWIQSWPPTGNGTTVGAGSYDTNGSGEDRVPASGTMSLANGHYKLFWQGSDERTVKHKVFWVDCPPGTGGIDDIPTPTPFEGDASSALPAPANGSATFAALLAVGAGAATLFLLAPLPRRVRRR